MIALRQQDFARLLGSLFYVSLGAAVALAATSLVFPPPDSAFGAPVEGTLQWSNSWSRHEAREKAFYLATLLLAGGAAWWGAARWSQPRHITLAACTALILQVPVAQLAIGSAMTSARSVGALYASGWLAFALASIWFAERSCKIDPSLERESFAGTPGGPRRILPSLAGSIVAVLVVTAAILPLRVEGIAAAIGFDMHMVSFMVGPATYAFGEALLPGIDYFTQYSVGTPWLFSHFIGATASQTVVNAVWFILGELLVFQLTLFFFLYWFLRSWWWALVVSIACLLLQFTTERPFYAPSSTAARYPLIVLVVAGVAWWTARSNDWRQVVWGALPLSLSLFLNTETGVYASVAGVVTLFVLGPGLLRPMARSAVLGVATALLLLAWNVIAFGPGVLQWEYVLLLTEPLRLYSSGLGAWSIEWLGGYHWIYNIVSPGLALATIGWAAASIRSRATPVGRAELAALVMFSTIGLLLTAKYINMSLVALWQVNSLGLVVVAAWWARNAVDQLPGKAGTREPAAMSGPWSDLRLSWRGMSTMASAALVILLFAFLKTIGDPRNPSLYAIQSYLRHPTIVAWALSGKEPPPFTGQPAGCTAVTVSAEDVALVTRLTSPKDRVALFGPCDWPTLIEARRASRFLFLPSNVIFTERQARESLKGLDLLFLPRKPAETLGIDNPDLAKVLVPMLKRDFKVVEETPNLLVWRRIH